MRFVKLFSLVSLVCLWGCSSTAQQERHKFTNHLAGESSPYLLQHAHNPVDWYPWGDEALEKARKENKMLIISIGYAACHWCHVMEHQSFEDSTVAKMMNDHFISIKVDREERPDVDDVYMTACQLASERGCGWPLNAFALPDGRPVWAGTYFPKKEWLKVMEYFIELYEQEPEKLDTYAAQLIEHVQLNELVSFNEAEQEFTAAKLSTVAKNFLRLVDFKKGGRGEAPKFPVPVGYEFLLKYHYTFDKPEALQAVEATLDNMAKGGIYDHLGGGFARYSTDADWHVPHFEKMLYDNGQLVSLYAHAFQVTKKDLYAKAVFETLAFVKRDLTSPEGGFYSSLDADSEREEGKFYVWAKAEVDSILNDQRLAAIFSDYFDVTAAGNWEEGKNVLWQRQKPEAVAKKHKLSEEELNALLREAKTKLYKARAKRIHPGLDTKILTAWNALMLKGYVDAYKAFGQEEFLETALRNAQFLVENMLQEDNRLNRNFKDGQSSINAFLDDYALTIQAFTALYEVTFDEEWLYKAQDLLEYTLQHFYHKPSGLFNYTSDLDPPLIARKMEVTDNVIPASNSVMARNLYTLGHYFYNDDYVEKARQMLHNVAESMSEYADYYSNWGMLYMDVLQAPYEVAIVGEQAAQNRKELISNYLPNVLFLGGSDEGTLQLLKDKLQEGETMIYVCQNKVCKLPVKETTKALELIKKD